MLYGVLGAYNLVVFAVYGADKRRAIRGKRRVPERVLLLLAGVLGGLGAYLAMTVFRHKTQKPRFSVGVPAMLAFQIALAVWAM